MIQEIALLKSCGLRPTPNRLSVLQTLFSSAETHFDIDLLIDTIALNFKPLSMGSVYRTLKEFEEAGLVLRHQFEGLSTVYELSREADHDHMVCVNCNQISEFYSDRMKTLQNEIPEKNGAQLVAHHHVLYVLCQQCR